MHCCSLPYGPWSQSPQEAQLKLAELLTGMGHREEAIELQDKVWRGSRL
jgi:Tfp pilus assembly protein FimV